MRLTFEHFDGHERYVDIIDHDTGKRVGHIQSHGSGFDRYGGMDIWLFGGKYRATVKPYEGNCRDATMILEVCPRLAGNNSIVSNAGDPTGWLGM